jgi:hypothetical protein
MTGSNTPSPPQRDLPQPSEEHFALYRSVREAIAALPVIAEIERLLELPG